MTIFLLSLLMGFFAGCFSALFGIGGGMLFVPALTLLFGLSQLHAQATSLAAIVPVVAVGTWWHSRRGRVNWAAAATIGLLSVAGVAGGLFLATELSDNALRKLFATFLVMIAARLAFAARRPRSD
jgi:uncharacterized membrane protein YfcA